MNRTASMLFAIVSIFMPVISVATDADSGKAFIEKATIFLYSRSDSIVLISSFADASLRSGTKNDSASAHFIKGMMHKVRGERSLTKDQYHAAFRLASELKNERLRNEIMIQQAILEREERNYKAAGRLIQDALVYFQTQGDSLNLYRSYFEYGQLLYDEGRSSAALHHYISAQKYIPVRLKAFAEAEVNKSIGMTYLKLAGLFDQIKPEKAAIYFKESARYLSMALPYYEASGHPFGICYCKLYLTESYMKSGEVDKSKELFNQCNSCKEYPDNEIQIRYIQLQAKIFEEEGKTKMAVAHLQQINALKFRLLSPMVFHEAYQQLGMLLYKVNEKTNGYNILLETAAWFEQKGIWLKAYEATSWLAMNYEQDQKIDLALLASKKAGHFKNLVVNEADMEIFDALRYQYKTDSLEAKLEKAEEASELQRKQIVFLVVTTILAGILMLLALVFVMMKRKKEILSKQLALETAATLRKEAEVRQLLIDQLKTAQELAQQKAATSKLEAEKNEQELLLNALRKTEVMNLQKEMLSKLSPFATKLSKKNDRDVFESLLNDYRHAAESDPMAQFEMVFKQAYGSFFSKLTEIAPDLTRSEIQIAVMLRLNLTSKEIAHILRLTTATIERTRHQIRQKLKLDPNQQLNAYLMAIG